VTKFPRILLALAIFLSGAALVPFMGLPTQRISWERFADAYVPASLEINYHGGAPGSSFRVRGRNYSPDIALQIFANGNLLGTVNTDSSGDFDIRINSTGATPGSYIITFSAEGLWVGFSLHPTEPTRPQEGSGPVYNLPPGIAYAGMNYLPIIAR